MKCRGKVKFAGGLDSCGDRWGDAVCAFATCIAVRVAGRGFICYWNQVVVDGVGMVMSR